MDIKLNYREKGSGKAMILLHGNGENGGYFHYQLEHFSNNYRVIAPDTRGHGESPRGDAPFTIRQFAEDLRCFMDELAIEKADILGFSDGGNIALCFAVKYPERVDRLILNGANLNPAGVKAAVQLPIVLGYHIARIFKGGRENAEMLGLMVNDPYIPEKELAGLHMPALVIAGDRDMIKERHTRRIAELLPKGQLCIIKGDHFIAANNPEEFNAAVERFLNEERND